LARNDLTKRMNAVSVEREKIRQRERERLARGDKVQLRASPKQYMKRIVDQVQPEQMGWAGGGAREADPAGYRGTGAYVTYLFFRLVSPMVALVVTLVYLFFILEMDKPPMVKLGMALFAAYCGMQLPWFFLKNKIQKRQLSIRRAFPDALDLLLICVESGMSIEAAFRKVSQEIGSQSIPARRGTDAHHGRAVLSAGPQVAYENLAKRTDLEGVKSRLRRAAAVRALRHAARPDATRDGAGKSRHAHVGSREEGRRAAAQAHRADDPVLPAGAVHRHSRARPRSA
jgi:tight adherence protein C